jgi:predicted Zn-ribbon and HTH transcriptional regulator
MEASKTFGIPLPRDKLVIIGRKFLLNGNLSSGLETYDLIKEMPSEEELITCGKKCLSEGLLSHGLEAFNLANKTPSKEELVNCGNRCFHEGWTTSGLEAYELASMTPTKEMLRACGEVCLLGKNFEEARKAFVAAQKIDEIKEGENIAIKETSLEELGASNELEGSWRCLVPIACQDCENQRMFEERLFILSRCPETKEEEEWLDKTMKEQYGVEHFAVGVFRDNRGLIDSAVCSECGSSNVLFES